MQVREIGEGWELWVNSEPRPNPELTSPGTLRISEGYGVANPRESVSHRAGKLVDSG
ncbi:hypothetical protein PS906_01566 [Pseudomonas fluorescens]|nr:hypothetical protein PS906_01566 [Pseudomonas fluorescens]